LSLLKNSFTMLPGKGKTLPVYGPLLHNHAQMHKPVPTPRVNHQSAHPNFFKRMNERLRYFFEGHPPRLSDTGRVRAPIMKFGPYETASLIQINRRRNRKLMLLLFILYLIDWFWMNWRDFCDAVFVRLSDDEIQRHRAPFLSFLFSRLPGYQEKKNMYEVVERVNRLQAKEFIRSVRVVPYGVLGSQLTDGSKTMLIIADPPDESTLIVDAVPITALEDDTRLPGGSKALREWISRRVLNTSDNAEMDFAIGTPSTASIGDCVAKRYGSISIVHCIIPDFRYGNWTKSSAISTLANCYANILKEFASPACECERLRLPILSSGRLAGSRIIEELPNITIEAMIRAFTLLKTLEQESLLMRIKNTVETIDGPSPVRLPRTDKRVDLCVFVEREWSMYDSSRDVLADRIY